MANDKWGGNNPWLGLAPYTEGTPLYGRTQESAVLSEIIKDNIATIVYGKSGIGKSSLLSAGISPMLRSEQFIPVPLRLVHNTDVSYVEQIENRVRELVDCKEELPENVPDLGLWDFFHRNTFTKDGVSCQPVIILDQFEEIYTLTDVEHKPEIIALFTELASLLNDIKPDAVLAAESSFTEDTTTSSSSDDDFSFELSTESSFAYNETVSFRFVICLREDKLYLLERNSANIPSIKTNRYNLQALSPDSALEVITYPRPDLFTKEDATAIVDKLADMGDEGIRTVDPAILSLFLYKYFEKKGEANYDNIFADYYHEATKGIKDKSLAFIEDHLLTLGGYRNQIPVDDALSSGVSSAEIESLLKQIILRSEKRKGIDFIEFSHDRLCAEAKKSRDERGIHLQRKKLWVRTLWGLFVIMSVVALSVLYVRESQKMTAQLSAQNENIVLKNKQLGQINRSLIAAEHEKDSINQSLHILFNLIESQRDSLKHSNAEITRINRLLEISQDSIQRVNSKLEEKYNNLAIKEQAERFKKGLGDISLSMSEEFSSIRNVFELFIKIQELAASQKYTQLADYAEVFNNYNLQNFPSLRLVKGEVVSLNGHFIYNEEFFRLSSKGVQYMYADKCNQKANIIGNKRQINENSVLYKNYGVIADSSLIFSFPSRKSQEIAVVAEPGGMVSVKIHITNKKGLDEWYITDSNFKKGEPYRKISFNIPDDVINNVEIEVVNCTNKDISFVLLSN